MLNLNKVRALALAVMMIASQARAEVSFIDLLKSLTPGKNNIVAEIPEMNQLMQSKDIQEAQGLLQNKLIQPNLERSSVADSNQVWNLIKQRNLTLVIVPGVLGEFIDTRAMEEVFARKSAARAQIP